MAATTCLQVAHKDSLGTSAGGPAGEPPSRYPIWPAGFMSDRLKQTMGTGKAHMALTMAGVAAASGAYGFAKSRSVPSLVAGLVLHLAGFAAVYGYAAHLISQGDCTEGHFIAAGASAALAAVMGRRAVSVAGLVSVPGAVSGIAAADCAYEAVKAK